MTYADNRRARFEYEILEKMETGIELKGYEVKAIRAGRVQLGGSYGIIRENEAWLLNCDISPYQQGNMPEDYESKRTRRLLITKKEISYLVGKLKEQKLTLVPLEMYNKGRMIKLALGLGKGKKTRDKRETIKARELDRAVRRHET